jgi:hypothetical protein
MKESGIGDPFRAPPKRTSSFETARLRTPPQDEVFETPRWRAAPQDEVLKVVQSLPGQA